MKQNYSFPKRVSAIAATSSLKSFLKSTFRIIPLLCMLALSGNAWGLETIGITSTLGTKSSPGSETITGVSGKLEVTKIVGKSQNDTLLQYDKGDKAMYCGSKTSQYAAPSYNSKKSSSKFQQNVYVGYKVTVADGYKYSLSSLNMKLATSANYTWKVVISDKDDKILYETSAFTIGNYNNSNATNYSLAQTFTGAEQPSLQNLKGVFYVRTYVYISSTGKYMCFPEFTIAGDLQNEVNLITVAYEPNGGTCDRTSNTYTGEALTLPTPDRKGYNFTGWYDADNKLVTSPYDPTKDVTLTAQWTPIEYRISYTGLEGVVNNPSNPDKYSIESETITFQEPAARDGYIFDGWSPASIVKGTTGDQTITAKWTPEPVNVFTFSYGEKDKAYQTVKFTQVGTTNEWQIKHFVFPDVNTNQACYVGVNGNWYNGSMGSANAKSADLYFWNMPLALLQTDNACSVCNQLNWDMNSSNGHKAIGTLRIFDNYSDDNLFVGFVPDGYGMMFGKEGEAWSSLAFAEEAGDVWTTTLTELTAEMTNGTFRYYVGLLTSDNAYTYCGNSATSGMKDMGVFYSEGWHNNLNQFGAGQRGKFRIWANSCNGNGTKNFVCHFVPYYGLCYNANYPAGVSETAPADTWSDFVSVEESRTLILAAAPVAPAGYIFKGWTTAQDGTGDLLNPGGDYALNNPAANTTLYAQWEENITPQCGTIPTPTQSIADATMTNDVQIYSINSNGYSNGTNIKENTSAPSHGVYNGSRVVIKFPVKTKKITIKTYNDRSSERSVNALSVSPTFGSAAADVNYTAIDKANYTHTVSGTRPNWEHEFTFTEAIYPTQYLRIEWDGSTNIYEICYERDATPDPSYTITFDNKGYGTAPASQTVTAYSLLTKPEDPVADDKLFKGWYTDSECTTEYDFKMPVTSSFTLYAKWADIPCFSMEITATSGSVDPNVLFTDAQAAIVGGTVVCDEHDYNTSLSFGADGAKLSSTYYLKVTLDGAVCLSVGTKVKITYKTNGSNRGIKLFASDKTTEILSVTNSEKGTFTEEKTITADIEEQVFYITRATNNETYIKSIEITHCGTVCPDPVPVLSAGDNAVLCSAGNVAFTATNYAPNARLELYRAGATEADPATLLKTIESATGESMNFEPIAVDATSSYYVVATAGCERPSEPVTVTLAKQPTAVTISGVPTEAAIGETYTFTATLVDGEGTDFQWYRNGNPIDGATAATYEFTPQKEDELQNIEFSCRFIGCGGTKLESNEMTTKVLFSSCYYITNGTELSATKGYDFGEDFVLYIDKIATKNNYGSSKNQICPSANTRYYTTGVTIYLKNRGAGALLLQGQQDYNVSIAQVEIADALDGTYQPLADYTAVNYESPAEGDKCGALGIENVQIPQGKYVHITFTGGDAEFRISGLCVEGLRCKMPELKWSQSEYTYNLGKTFAAPELTTVPEGLLITYSSSDETVATVDAAGAVTVIGMGTTTISAVFEGDDTYCATTASYVLTVICGDDVPQIAPEEGSVSCTAVELRLLQSDGTTPVSSGNVQWYRNGVAIEGATGYTYTATTAGEYTATLEQICTVTTSNKAVIASTVTPPDIKAFSPFRTHQITGREVDGVPVRPYSADTHYPLFTLKPTVPDDGTKLCRFTLVVRNGNNVRYAISTPTDNDKLDWIRRDFTLDGTIHIGANYPKLGEWIRNYNETHTDNPFVVGDTIWLTAHPLNACGEYDMDVTATIPIKLTDKFSIAYIITGQDGGSFYEINQDNLGAFYQQFRESYYEITPVNAYAPYDYYYYEPYDLVILTDYPKASGNKDEAKPERVNALADLVDRKPMLSFKAHMADSKLTAWKALGFISNPQVPDIVQTKIQLLCSDHPIFEGEKIGQVEILSQGEKDDKKVKGLQGFAELGMDGFVNIATVDDGNNGTLVACCERQDVVEARLVVLSIYSGATQYITTKGMQAVDNVLEYLLQTDETKLSDCSIIFNDATGDKQWTTAANWQGGNVPNRLQNVRIEADCEVSGGKLQIISNVNINNKYRLTIKPDGALGSLGKFSLYSDENKTYSDITDPGYVTIEADDKATGALLHTQYIRPLVATVQLYSKAHIEMVDGKKKNYWAYVGIPVQEAPVPQFFNGAYTWQYDETDPNVWIRYGNGTTMTAFEGYGLSQPAPQLFTLTGQLVSAKDRVVTLTKTAGAGEGQNLIGNSWTAPIQITLLEATDFGEGLQQTVYIYNTGRDAVYGEGAYGGADDATPGQWRTIPIEAAKLEGYAGPKTIPAMQAFEVDFSEDATQTTANLTLEYNRVVRTSKGTDLNMPLYAPRRKAQAVTDEPELMRICVEDSRTRTELYLLQDGRFTDEFDNGWDGFYMEGNGPAAGLWAFTPVGDMAVSAQPAIDGTTLGFRPGRENLYTFSFQWEGEVLYLNDMLLRQSVQIRTGNTYAFTAFDNEAENRFVISHEPCSEVNTSLADIVLTGDLLTLNNPAGELLDVLVYDPAGRICTTRQTADNLVKLDLPATQGVYMVCVRTTDGNKVYKVVR